MKIAAITKFKHGALWEAMNQLGWNQSELSRRSDIHPSSVGKYCNLVLRPSVEDANKIQNAFAEAGLYVDVTAWWPETFKGFRRSLTVTQVKEINLELVEPEFFERIADPQTVQNDEEPALDMVRRLAVGKIEPRDLEIFESVHFDGKSLDEAGKPYGLRRERVRQITRRSLHVIWKEIAKEPQQ